MNRNLRIGIQTGVSLGLAMGFLGYFNTGSIVPTVIYAIAGILFGAIVAWFNSRLDHRLKAKGFDPSDRNPVQLRTVNYPGHLQEAIEATKQAFQLVRKLKAVTETPNPSSLKAKTGVTFESFGENIAAEFSLGPAGTEITVTSKPRVITAQMDTGKNVENVETIVRALMERGATRRVA